MHINGWRWQRTLVAFVRRRIFNMKESRRLYPRTPETRVKTKWQTVQASAYTLKTDASELINSWLMENSQQKSPCYLLIVLPTPASSPSRSFCLCHSSFCLCHTLLLSMPQTTVPHRKFSRSRGIWREVQEDFESRVIIENWQWVSQGCGRFFSCTMANPGSSLRFHTHWSAPPLFVRIHRLLWISEGFTSGLPEWE